MPPVALSYYEMVEYEKALEMQRLCVQEVDREKAGGFLLLLQHPPVYTIGTRKHPEHLLWDEKVLREKGISVVYTDRGGDITYHGPGQLVGYPILYISPERVDLHQYLRDLEQVIIDCLAEFGVKAGRKANYTGVWVEDRKIAAIGVKFHKCRYRRGFVTSHGFSLNVSADLSGFAGIVPCGIREFGVTSLEACTGKSLTVRAVAESVARHFSRVFRCEMTPA